MIIYGIPSHPEAICAACKIESNVKLKYRCDSFVRNEIELVSIVAALATIYTDLFGSGGPRLGL